MTRASTRSHDLVASMLFLIDPRTEEADAVTAIARMDLDTAQELLTLVSNWAAGELEVRADRLEVTPAALMAVIEGELREVADQMDRLDHEGGLFT